MKSEQFAAIRPRYIGGILLVCAALTATPVHAGFLDNLKKGLDNVSDGLQKAEDALDDSKNKPSNSTNSQPQNNNSKPAPAQQKTQSMSQQSSAKPDRNATNILSQKSTYHLWPQYFKSFPFKTGDYKIVKDKDGTFIPLYLPVYKGMPRLGALPEYKRETGAGGKSMQQVRYENALKTALSTRFANDLANHLMLCNTRIYAKEFTERNMMADSNNLTNMTTRNQTNIPHLNGLHVRFEMEKMASAMLSPEKAKVYFCADGKPCGTENVMRFSPQNKGIPHHWGGNKNEFTIRKAYRDFVKKELPKLKSWAAKQSCDYYLVGKGKIEGYDFGKKQISIRVPLSYAHLAAYEPRSKDKNYSVDSNNITNISYKSMSDADAEALFARIKNLHKDNPLATTYGYPVYTVIKVQVYKHKAVSGFGMIAVAHDITSPKVEVYADDLLTIKLFEVAMKKY
jgi:hypothetical protein